VLIWMEKLKLYVPILQFVPRKAIAHGGLNTERESTQALVVD